LWNKPDFPGIFVDPLLREERLEWSGQWLAVWGLTGRRPDEVEAEGGRILKSPEGERERFAGNRE